MLSHAEASFRAWAAWALGQIGNPEAIPALRKVLQDENLEVQTTARQALESLGDVKSDILKKRPRQP